MTAPNPLRLSPPTCEDRLIWDVERSAFHFPTLAAADELGLFPLLHADHMTATQVAQALSLGPRATEALLGVLTSLGFLTQSQGTFGLTEVSRTYLLPSSPYYRGSIIKLFGNVPLTSATILEALKRKELRPTVAPKCGKPMKWTPPWQRGSLTQCTANRYHWRWESP